MKEIVKTIIQIIVLLAIAKLCRICGDITGYGFDYGVLWFIICVLVVGTEITIVDTDEDGNETRKRIY